MDTHNEKPLRRFQVTDTSGNVLKTVDILYRDEYPDNFAIKCDSEIALARSMGQAMLSAEILHLYEARKRAKS